MLLWLKYIGWFELFFLVLAAWIEVRCFLHCFSLRLNSIQWSQEDELNDQFHIILKKTTTPPSSCSKDIFVFPLKHFTFCHNNICIFSQPPTEEGTVFNILLHLFIIQKSNTICMRKTTCWPQLRLMETSHELPLSSCQHQWMFPEFYTRITENIPAQQQLCLTPISIVMLI